MKIRLNEDRPTQTTKNIVYREILMDEEDSVLTTDQNMPEDDGNEDEEMESDLEYEPQLEYEVEYERESQRRRMRL